MFSRQHELPNLPLPSIKHTVAAYCESLLPLTSSGDHSRIRKLLNDFERSEDVAKLQEALEQRRRDPSVENWLAQWWSDAYLTDRQSPGLHVSPSLGFMSKPGTSQLHRAADIVNGALEFYNLVVTEALAVDTIRGKPLCMRDYRALFAAARVPGLGRDVMEYHVADRPRHIVVMARGHFYRLAAMNRDGVVATESSIRDALEAVLNHASQLPSAATGMLTYLDRDAWATQRGKLLQDGAGRAFLHEVESAVFVLTLDDCCPKPDSEDSIHALLHGHDAAESATGTWRCVNRWWDKTLQLHVAANSEAGLTFEHSAMDSLPILSLTKHIHTRSRATTQNETANPVAWSHLRAPVAPATVQLVEDVKMLDARVLVTHGLGSKRIRACGVSPDAFVQLCAQVAFHELRGCTPVTYESAGTKTFLLGRTETLRVVSEDSVAFVSAIREKVPAPRVCTLLRAAAATHVRRGRQAAAGAGCDRHLFGLRCTALATGHELPELLRDSTFTHFSDISLSTTHPMEVPGARMVGFGPVVSAKCIGLGYFIFQDSVSLGVTSLRRDATEFASKVRAVMERVIVDLESSAAKL